MRQGRQEASPVFEEDPRAEALGFRLERRGAEPPRPEERLHEEHHVADEVRDGEQGLQAGRGAGGHWVALGHRRRRDARGAPRAHHAGALEQGPGAHHHREERELRRAPRRQRAGLHRLLPAEEGRPRGRGAAVHADPRPLAHPAPAAPRADAPDADRQAVDVRGVELGEGDLPGRRLGAAGHVLALAEIRPRWYPDEQGLRGGRHLPCVRDALLPAPGARQGHHRLGPRDAQGAGLRHSIQGRGALLRSRLPGPLGAIQAGQAGDHVL
mmetsp:Transcript_80583/g.213922  ORF Transcript_80583/g.213922 Transcript_80583/m.213922 type:complete len:269 (+) Transcript_80583:939-1745(+)